MGTTGTYIAHLLCNMEAKRVCVELLSPGAFENIAYGNTGQPECHEEKFETTDMLSYF